MNESIREQCKKILLDAVSENSMDTGGMDYWHGLSSHLDANAYHYGENLGVTVYMYEDGKGLISEECFPIFLWEVGEEPLTHEQVKQLLEREK